jgi:hypothetical protein
MKGKKFCYIFRSKELAKISKKDVPYASRSRGANYEVICSFMKEKKSFTLEYRRTVLVHFVQHRRRLSLHANSMISIENVASDSSRDVPLPPNSGSGVGGKHPSTLLMHFLDTPAVKEGLVRRVHGGFGDVYKVSKVGRIMTLELDFLSCEAATAMATIIAEELACTQKSTDDQMCAISYEIVPGEGGRLTNVRTAVRSNSRVGRSTMRLVMSNFLLRCFRRNQVIAFFLKHAELRS